MMPSVAEINNLGGYAHNPRGNLWFNDESTYGHKLLAKMGWNKGKGLGKNEDGIKENLKVKFRSTNSGLGFKDDPYANVMKTEYESILKNLSAEYSCSETASLNENVKNTDEEPVQQSKVVKSKLRYPKLFFGKDVTKYSEKDMKSIFICSLPLKDVEEKSEKTIIADNKDFEIESPPAIDTYKSNLSISDYFAKKMEEKKCNTLNNKSSNSCPSPQHTKNSETPILCANGSIMAKRKKKDSQIKTETESVNIDKPSEAIEEIEIIETENLSLSNKKSRKRKKESEINIEDIEVNSSNFTKEEVLGNSLCNNISYNSNKCIDETIPNQNSYRPKKKRKRSQVFENDTAESSGNTFHCKTESSSLVTKNKKSKNKKYSGTVLLSSENSRSEKNTSTEILEGTNNHFLLEPVQNVLLNSTEECSRKKKKSKRKLKEKLKSCLKSKRGSYSLKNVSFNKAVSYRIIDSEIESVGPLGCSKNSDEDAVTYESTDNDANDSVNDACPEDKPISNESNENDDIVTTEEQDEVSEGSNEELRLSDLPSSKSSHYNAWIESQRQALKMHLYKKMLKSIKNHKILKTSNLLSIKGYGNWGYNK